MDEFASNSNKSKQNAGENKIMPVVNAKASIKKTSVMAKIAQLILPEDIQLAKTRIREGVIAPSIQQMIIKSVETFFNTKTNSSIGTAISTTILKSGNVTPYNSISSGSSQVKVSPGVYRFDPVVVTSMEDADILMRSMRDYIAESGCCSIANMYDMANLGDCIKSTDNYYGWTDLKEMSCKSYIEDGQYKYLISCPKASPLPKRV